MTYKCIKKTTYEHFGRLQKLCNILFTLQASKTITYSLVVYILMVNFIHK